MRGVRRKKWRTPLEKSIETQTVGKNDETVQDLKVEIEAIRKPKLREIWN